MFIPNDVIQLIMVTYFRPNALLACVSSIIENTPEPFHLTIIDNSHGGIDDTLNKLNNPQITIHKNTRNLGKGKAFMHWYNQITQNNNADYVVSIDQDLIVPKTWLTMMLRAAHTVNNPGIFAPVIINEIGDTFDNQKANGKLIMHKDGSDSIKIGVLYKNRHTAGPLFLINKKFFEQVGGYVQTQLYGNDDGELCKAAYRKRRFVGIVTNVEVLHLDVDSTPEYKQWKKRNVNRDVDHRGFWDQS